MDAGKVQNTVEIMRKLEELRQLIDKGELHELIDSVPSLLRSGKKLSINDGLKIVAGK